MLKSRPAPSRGALRVLRQIAYAGSFVGSVGGGAVILEDRRRRICTAREVHENARRLKSSRQYHGVALAEQFEDNGGHPSERAMEMSWSKGADTSRGPLLPTEVNKAYESIGRTCSRRPLSKTERALPQRDAKEHDDHGRRQTNDHTGADQYDHPPTSSAALATKRQASHYRLVDTVKKYLASQPQEDKSPNAQVHRLLSKSKVRDATSLFLETYFKNGQAKVDHKAVRLGSTISAATLWKKQYDQTERIFWQMQTDKISYDCWANLLQAYLMQKRYSSLLSLFDRFRDLFQASDLSYVPVTECLVAQSRFAEAEELLKSVASARWYRLQACYTILLGGTWRSSKDLERTLNLFKRMQTWSEEFKPCLPLLNTLVRSCVEAGREEEAHAVLQSMTGKWGLQPNIRTYGHLILAKARRKEWEKVEEDLGNLRDSGVIGSSRSSSHILNSLVIDYTRQFPDREIEPFARRLIDTYGLVPDQSTSDILVRSLVKVGQGEAVKSWENYIQEKGLRLKIDPKVLGSALEWFCKQDVNRSYLNGVKYSLGRNRITPSPKQRPIDKHETASCQNGANETLSADDVAETRDSIARQNVIRRETVDRRRTESTVDNVCFDAARSPKIVSQEDTAKLQLKMSQAIRTNVPAEAVRMYRTAITNGMIPSREVIETALEASIRADNGSFDEAYELLRSARHLGVNIHAALTPLFIHRLYRSKAAVKAHVGSDVKAAALDFCQQAHVLHVRLTNHVVVSTASYLTRNGMPDEAVDLLSTVAKAPFFAHRPFDIVVMTVFFRAYAALDHHVQGMRWVVQMVLASDMRLDNRFLDAVKAVRAPLRRTKEKLGFFRAHAHGGDGATRCESLVRLLDGWIAELHAKRLSQSKRAIRQGRQMLHVLRRAEELERERLGFECMEQDAVPEWEPERSGRDVVTGDADVEMLRIGSGEGLGEEIVWEESEFDSLSSCSSGSSSGRGGGSSRSSSDSSGS
ncbi:MAG: hypothetical protein M1819_004544 [Sarea resinae]|nr:MAG: hypothetical protein M1819_004544 [Sarea resinae]